MNSSLKFFLNSAMLNHSYYNGNLLKSLYISYLTYLSIKLPNIMPSRLQTYAIEEFTNFNLFKEMAKIEKTQIITPPTPPQINNWYNVWSNYMNWSKYYVAKNKYKFETDLLKSKL